jgi:CO dehydrogenase maturation factor
MKVAVAGKGGSGKTTLAGTLARLLARGGRAVLAVDGDSNPNLGVSLGLPREQALAIPPLPRDLLRDGTRPDGSRFTALAMPPAELAARYGVRAPDGVVLLVMGKVGHAGAG